MFSHYPLKKRIKHALKNIETSPFVTDLLGCMIFLYAKLTGLTTRWQIRNIDQTYQTWEKDKAIILIIWHGRALLPCYFWKNKKKFPISALVSPHRDGRLIAIVLRLFGMKVINGSSNENSHGAALSLMRELQKGHGIAIIPDGPKGPNMKMSSSALYFAQKSGYPIIGMTYSVKGSKFVTKSWDKMLVPPLFSKGIVATTKPFYVSDKLSNEEFDLKKNEIEKELTELTWALDKELGLPKVEQGTISRPKKYPVQGNK